MIEKIAGHEPLTASKESKGAASAKIVDDASGNAGYDLRKPHAVGTAGFEPTTP
jgi:hypothetical protein